ncbi:MAG: class I SAM-dependent methyltransferase [Thermoplasmata archaeon]|nr:class I SAM-dependent methyltransferase [Thermoplasmata archaeon]MBE3139794.1 class I SAM-dependent methyltransferase [Thermoplasmata archaeon]
MDPALCRSLNTMSLELLADYLNVEFTKIDQLYKELLGDQQFLDEINEQIQKVRLTYQKGIFRHSNLESVDWFAIQRIILYILVRLNRPSVCLETGVFYGGTTCFILNALRRNHFGKLISIDLPRNSDDKMSRHYLVGDSEDIPQGLDIGFIVHPAQKERWTLIRGNSLEEIPRLNEKIDLYNHDSDHSFAFIKQEMTLVWEKLNSNALIMADDLDWSNGFYSFCVEKKLYPLIITDNGKSGLKARTGIVKIDHPSRKKKDITG